MLMPLKARFLEVVLDSGRMTGNPEVMLALGPCSDRFRFADKPGVIWCWLESHAEYNQFYG